MTTPDSNHLREVFRQVLSRRQVLAGTGALVALPGLGSAAADHGDDQGQTDGGHVRNDGRGGEDAPVVTGTVPAGSAQVRILSDDPDGFAPATVTIDAGQSVTFINTQHDAHTATGGQFGTGILQPGTMATITFAEAGTFPYACKIHPMMNGTVVVHGPAGLASPVAATPVPASPVVTTAANAAVTIQNFAFDPPELRVAVGTTATWTNRDQIPHTATAADGSFTTGALDPGGRGSVRFAQPGQVSYHCAFHPSMTGTIIVT
ncbi:MAG: cupredoxin domain-containing protein [Thermomicrobiales bacterium]